MSQRFVNKNEALGLPADATPEQVVAAKKAKAAEKAAEKERMAEPVDADAEAEKLSEVEHHKQQSKTYRDKYASTKGEAETLRKMALKLEGEGLLDRDELAKDIGVKRDYLDAVIDRKDLPEPGEDGHMDLVRQRMDEDYLNPVVQKALVKVYGDVNAQQEIAKAFNFAVDSDPDLKERWNQIKPEDAMYFVLDQGKEALDDYREASANGGGPRALVAENRALKAEIAALKAPKKVITQATETEQATEQEELPAPKSAREARVRAFMN